MGNGLVHDASRQYAPFAEIARVTSHMLSFLKLRTVSGLRGAFCDRASVAQRFSSVSVCVDSMRVSNTTYMKFSIWPTKMKHLGMLRSSLWVERDDEMS